MKPIWQIKTDDQDVTPRIQDRFISLMLAEEGGIVADAFELRVDNRDRRIRFPRLGAYLHLALGWRNGDGAQSLKKMGSFLIDEIAHQGLPEVLIIRGKAADLAGMEKHQKSRSWDDTTLAAIATEIAAENGWDPRVDGAADGIALPHADQMDESDLVFLNRLAEDADMMAMVKDRHLLLTKKSNGLTVSGRPLPPVAVTLDDVQDYRVTLTKRFDYDGVSVGWHDYAAGRQKRVVAGHDKGALLRVQHLAANEAEATRRAEAIFLERRRGMQTLTCRLLGAPQAIAEGPLDLTGFADGCNGRWIAKAVVHKIDGRGFVTDIKAERPDDHVYGENQLPHVHDDCVDDPERIATTKAEREENVRRAERVVNAMIKNGQINPPIAGEFFITDVKYIDQIRRDPGDIWPTSGQYFPVPNTEHPTGYIEIYKTGATSLKKAIITYAHEVGHTNPKWGVWTEPVLNRKIDGDAFAEEYGQKAYKAYQVQYCGGQEER